MTYHFGIKNTNPKMKLETCMPQWLGLLLIFQRTRVYLSTQGSRMLAAVPNSSFSEGTCTHMSHTQFALAPAPVVHTCNPRGRGRLISPSWSTQQVPSQLGLLNETLSQKTKPKHNKHTKKQRQTNKDHSWAWLHKL